MNNGACKGPRRRALRNAKQIKSNQANHSLVWNAERKIKGATVQLHCHLACCYLITKGKALVKFELLRSIAVVVKTVRNKCISPFTSISKVCIFVLFVFNCKQDRRSNAECSMSVLKSIYVK